MTQTLDRLFTHAEQQPNVVAVIDGDDAFTYAQFAKQLCQFAATLKEFNLSKGDIVAVEWMRLYPHWLFLLACEIHGYRCLSFGREELDSVGDFLKDHAKLVIASNPIEFIDPSKTYLFTSNEYQRVNQLNIPVEEPTSVLKPENPMRLQCSSGTTGLPKFMERSLKLHNFRINQLQGKDIYTKQSRLVLAYNFAVQASYGRATACLEAGGTIIHPNDLSVANHLIKYRATHITLLPTTLRQLLSLLPEDFKKPKDFTLSTFGGKIPKTIHEKATERLADKIVESYGTNETGSICTMIEEGLGMILPDVEVEIVNDTGKSVLNQTGTIRIRGKGLVDGYLFDPINTADKFKDGWFYPGDIGFKPDHDHLKLQGRMDDLINIGGVKKLLPELEEYIRPHIQVEDFCLCETMDAKGVQTIWLCIVPNTQTNPETIKDIIKPILQNSLENVVLKAVNEIPRTPTNKIRRQEMAKFLTANSV